MLNMYIEQIRSFRPCCEQEERDQDMILALCERHRDILTRENRAFHLTGSGLILNETRDKMLMVHHNIYRTWTWTGGHADGQEDLRAVALREAAEETGAAPGLVGTILEEMASLDVIPVFGHVKNGAHVSAHLHLNAAWLLCVPESAGLAICEGENSGVAWVPLAEVASRSQEPELIRIFGKMLARVGVGFGG